jgi:hypothetical protein
LPVGAPCPWSHADLEEALARSPSVVPDVVVGQWAGPVPDRTSAGWTSPRRRPRTAAEGAGPRGAAAGRAATLLAFVARDAHGRGRQGVGGRVREPAAGRDHGEAPGRARPAAELPRGTGDPGGIAFVLPFAVTAAVAMAGPQGDGRIAGGVESRAGSRCGARAADRDHHGQGPDRRDRADPALSLSPGSVCGPAGVVGCCPGVREGQPGSRPGRGRPS